LDIQKVSKEDFCGLTPFIYTKLCLMLFTIPSGVQIPGVGFV